LKKLKNSKSSIIGSWIQLGDPDITRVMALSGFDFVVFDMEHGSINENDLPMLFDSLTGTECIPFVRVAKNENILIRRSLDLGAKGIIVPGVNNLQDVQNAKNSIFFPPKGNRGIGFSRANEYGLNFNDYFSSSNDNVKLVIQIESEEAVSNIDEIFSIPDDIFSYIIGPYDLSGSMKKVGKFQDPTYLKSLKKIKKSAFDKGVNSGIHIIEPNIDQLKNAINDGYNFIAYSTDALLLYNKCHNDLNEISKINSK